jgi:septal ring factor EnvC (AmiA/AmiB activator)
MKESDDDGLMSGEPDVLKNKSKKEDDENMEKSDTEPVEKEDENMEKEVDADIEKVAKKLKLSAKQKQDLYNQKEMNKLPKGIVKQLEKSSAKINELEKKIQILQAGQDAFVNAFSDDKPVINKVNKTFVKQTIDTTPDMKVNKQNPAKYNSFNSLRNILGGK